LFVYHDDIYGVSPTEGLIKLDKNLKRIESTHIDDLNILSPIVSSNSGIWFIGSDIDINNFSDEVLPANNTVFYYSSDITKLLPSIFTCKNLHNFKITAQTLNILLKI